MQIRRGWRTAGQHKRGQRGQPRIQAVDVVLKAFDLAGQYPQPFRLALALGHREVGAEIEQIVLDQAQHRIKLARVRQMKPHDANGGVGLVDGSIRTDAQIVFRAAFAAAERRGPVIAGSRVDTIENDHCLFLLQRPIAQTASMVITIATNCSSTRSRISFCERFGDPPRIMLSRPSSNTSATAPTAIGSMIVLRNEAMAVHNTAPSGPPSRSRRTRRSGFLSNNIRW